MVGFCLDSLAEGDGVSLGDSIHGVWGFTCSCRHGTRLHAKGNILELVAWRERIDRTALRPRTLDTSCLDR